MNSFFPGEVRGKKRGVAQLGLERYVRDVEVGGSNPLTPTNEGALGHQDTRAPVLTCALTRP